MRLGPRRAAVALAASLILGKMPAIMAQQPGQQSPPGATDELPYAPDSVTGQLFDRNLLARVRRPATLAYDVTVQTADAQDPTSGHVTMDVREVQADGAKKVWFKIEGAPSPYEFGPVDADKQNPLLIVLLQIDVTQMQKLTGGSPQYFRSRLKEAFNAPAKVAPVDVDFDGRKLSGTSLSIQPYRDDPHLQAHPELRDKVYVFVVADDVPGGIYQIAMHTPEARPGARSSDQVVTLTHASETE